MSTSTYFISPRRPRVVSFYRSSSDDFETSHETKDNVFTRFFKNMKQTKIQDFALKFSERLENSLENSLADEEECVQLITLNINGFKYQMPKSVFDHISIRQMILNRASRFYNKLTDEVEYFLDRDVTSFVAILTYLKGGDLHMPNNICPVVFKRELQYWRIPVEELQICCFTKLTQFQSVQDQTWSYLANFHYFQPKYISQKLEGTKKRFYDLLYRPKSSLVAHAYKFIAIFTFLAVVLQTLLITAPPFLNDELTPQEKSELITMCNGHQHHLSDELVKLCHKNEDSVDKTNIIPHNSISSDTAIEVPPNVLVKRFSLQYLAIPCLIFITFDYVVRLMASPDKKRYIFDFLSITQLLSISGLVLELAIYDLKEKYVLANEVDHFKFTAILKMMIVCNVYRSYKYFYIFRHCIRNARRSMVSSAIMILTVSLVFATGMYTVDKEDMKNIPEAYYFSVTTITSVGNGKLTPGNVAGKFLAGIACLIGVITFATTLPFVVGDFKLLYNLYQNDTLLSTRERKKIKLQKLLRKKRRKTIFTSVRETVANRRSTL